MAKLTISEASRVAGVARSTLHRAIKAGRMSLDAEGKVDTAELLRCGYTLQGNTQHHRATVRQDATPQDTDALQAPLSASALVIEGLKRERDLLQQQLDATQSLLQSERQRAMDLERERRDRAQERHDREALLLHMLQDAQQRFDRLLTAPQSVSQSTPGPAAGAHVPRSPAVIPETWQAILRHMQQAGRQTPQQVQQVLRLAHSPKDKMYRMQRAGLLIHMGRGVYGLPDEEH